MRFLHFLILLFVLSAVALSATAAEPLQGAIALLDSLSDKIGKTDTAPKPVSDGARLRFDLTNFTARSAALTPGVAAQEWVSLADRLASLPPPMRDRAVPGEEPPPQVQDLIAALPPPAAWDELAKIIAARPAPAALKDTREFGLRMLARALTGDSPGLAGLASAFEALLVKAKRDDAIQLVHAFRALDEALLALSDDPKAILAGVERQLAAAESDNDHGYSSITLPDLVVAVGETNATPFIRRALFSKSRALSIQGKATEALARKIALAEINELKVPRWELVRSIEALELYEAMARKFTQPVPKAPANSVEALAQVEKEPSIDQYEKLQANTYYLMALIVRGRTADAAAFARRTADEAEQAGGFRVEGEAVASLERAGFTSALDEFLFELLTPNPELPYWETYVSVAAKTGHTDRMLALARAAAAKPALAGQKRVSIRENLYRALLAADQVEEGVKELRALLQSAPKDTRKSSRNTGGGMSAIEWQNHALTLARLGRLLERPEWVSEGLALAMPKPDVKGNSGDDPIDRYQERGIVEVLVQDGRPAEAEKLLADQLARALKQDASQPGRFGMPMVGSPATEPLRALIALYHHAGKHEDVLILLERSPHWGVKDLVQLLTPGSGGEEVDFENSGAHNFQGPRGSRLANAVAAALKHAGRKAEALAIVDFMLDRAGGDDRAYELLVQLAEPEALARMNSVFARDRFEERPLIWKALLLHQAGKDAEAEQVARQAIAIDPSDGEQGKGDRMRVYAVLADIRAARGDQKEAEFLRGVVRAIRLSERADDFHAAGLLSRAVKMYQDSLNHFADAYCVQSRLAVQLSALGQHELAAKHYEKAFELMPDSFGRVESHCFGCESTFADAQAQTLAERVFTLLAAKNPNKPQIHYLLGYLRQQQQRGREALPHFRRALQLDPDYLNAWEHIEQLSQEQRLPAAERDDIFLNILRLDPLRRHTSANPERIGDLRKLWTATETASKFETKTPTTLLPMPASRDEVEKQERAAKGQPNQMFGGYPSSRYARDHEAGLSPGRALSRHPLLQAIAGLMSGAEEFASTE